MTAELQDPPEDVIYALDLDEEIVSHLAETAGVATLRAEQVSSVLIEDPYLKEVFDWQMEHVRLHGKPASRVVLENQFDGEDGRPALDIVAPQTAVGDLIVRLRERYVRNEGRAACRRLSEVSVSDPLDTAREMLKEGRRLADLISRRGEIYGTGDYDRVMMEYDRLALQGRGPSLGYPELDDHFNGMIGVTFLMAPPKAGKSWQTVKVATQNVLAGKMPYLYSLELPAIESDMRILCMAADVPYWRYLKRCLSRDDRQRLDLAQQELDGSGLYKVEKPAPGERGVQRMIERALNAGADCILIDQLQYVENEKGHSLGALNSTGDYFEVVNSLRNYSDDIPIYVVHQFNRSVMNAKEMPEMQQGKGSSSIEEVATLVLGMWANKEMRKNNILQLGTLASRNYTHEAWEIDIALSRGCDLVMRGKVEEEDDE